MKFKYTFKKFIKTTFKVDYTPRLPFVQLRLINGIRLNSTDSLYSIVTVLDVL